VLVKVTVRAVRLPVKIQTEEVSRPSGNEQVNVF
jgi:hypothetical protein